MQTILGWACLLQRSTEEQLGSSSARVQLGVTRCEHQRVLSERGFMRQSVRVRVRTVQFSFCEILPVMCRIAVACAAAARSRPCWRVVDPPKLGWPQNAE
jgi:hypothetical protein